MKIAMFEIEPRERNAFAELEKDHEIVYREGQLDEEAAQEVADADSRCSSTPSSIATCSTGSTASG